MTRGDLFKRKSDHIVPFIRGLPPPRSPFLGQKPERCSSPQALRGLVSCPSTHSLTFPGPPRRPSLPLNRPHSSQPQDLCTLLLSRTSVPPSWLTLSFCPSNTVITFPRGSTGHLSQLGESFSPTISSNCVQPSICSLIHTS